MLDEAVVVFFCKLWTHFGACSDSEASAYGAAEAEALLFFLGDFLGVTCGSGTEEGTLCMQLRRALLTHYVLDHLSLTRSEDT